MLNFAEFRFLTFDCYGTLIDWEAGILAALRPLLMRHGKSLGDSELLSLYGKIEAEVERESFLPYRQVLAEVVRRLGRLLEFEATEAEAWSLPESLASWPAFPDSVAALKQLGSHFRLAVLSNVDDDLFVASAAKLGNPFELAVTAQQVGSYKPSLNNFHALLSKLAELGINPSQVLHVAQSRFHDILPAKQLGLATVWVNRYRKQPGATPVVNGSSGGNAEGDSAEGGNAEPDVEVPSLAALVALIWGGE